MLGVVAADPRTVAQKQPAISLDGVSMRFRLRRGEEVAALDRISLQVADGEFVALLGPSGCGKSTILRLAASLEEPTEGVVKVGGDAPAALARSHRLGVAFQDHALLPWLSVASNIGLPFKVAGRPVDERRVSELLRLIGLEEFGRARPKQLSGGMRQRVSIARALALHPDLLLLDEPFGALDAVTRRQMNLELQRIWLEESVTTLLVTHSVEEALFLTDRVIVLTGRPGRVKRVVPVAFSRPRTSELARTDAFHRLADELTSLLEEASDPQS